MEHPGAILYRQSRVFLDEAATQERLLGRASLIAHETAHMWFGDLVTMEWFDDVWMKEVFANFMAAKIVNPAFPDVDHDLRFLLAHYPVAYGVDRTRGANAIRQPLENLQQAGTLYGAIIYQKAPVVMKHLELLMGEDPFRDGLREYLATHQFGNATWSDLIEILDARTELNLPAWSEVWVQEPGRPTIAARLDVEGGAIASLTLSQADPAEQGRTWRQHLEVMLGYHGRPPRYVPVELDTAQVEISAAQGLPVPDYVLSNGRGVGYGLFRLDEATRTYLLEHITQVDDAVARGVAWVSLWDAMLIGDVAPRRFVALAQAALPVEGDELNTGRILGYLTAAYWRYLTSEVRGEIAPEVERVLWRLVRTTPHQTLRAAFFSAYRNVALTPEATERLRRIWQSEEVVDGLPISEADMTALAEGLAIRDPENADEILEEQLGRIDNPDRRARFEFVRPALSPDRATRDDFFASLEDPRSREREPWVLDAVRFLHHPLRTSESLRYLRPSLELLEEIQRTGDIFFPQRWLGATLGSHNSSAAAAIVREFIDDRSDLLPRLMGKMLQSADPLFVAAQILDMSGPR
jgi:aminopeptidase N